MMYKLTAYGIMPAAAGDEKEVGHRGVGSGGGMGWGTGGGSDNSAEMRI